MATATKNQYFQNCDTLEKIKAEYRRLALLHHPDRGGNHNVMVEINRTYETALQSLNKRDTNKTSNFGDYNFTRQQFDAFMWAKEFFKYCGDIQVIPDYSDAQIYISGNTYPYKEYLKKQGFWWQPADRAWRFVRKTAAPTGKKWGAA